MSGQKKRLAHDVVLHHLESMLREPKGVSRYAERQKYFVFLCELLSDIAIPEENAQAVCDALSSLEALCKSDFTARYCLKKVREEVTLDGTGANASPS